ncbi:MAG: hypothetical protein IPJ65_00215 [Archangiaceae bacterium]|nr:hypothetical protein [Archangiaceae bacterium]
MSRPFANRRPRGAATVELAIGSLLWVTVTLLGLWMSEVSFLTTKVQEAASSGVWNAAGRKVDDYSVANNASGNSDYNAAINGASAQTTSRYADFDGVRGNGSGTRRLLARGSGLRMTCAPGAGRTPLAFDSPARTTYDDGRGATPARVTNELRNLFKARPATMCTASAFASPWQLPQTFLDDPGKGFFKTPMYTDGSILLCGAGRAKNGRCPEAYAVLLGDWAVDGRRGAPITHNLPLPLETDTQTSHPNNNLPYRDMVRRVFLASGDKPNYQAGDPGEAASAKFQRRMSNMKRLHNEQNFYMSYAGVESDYGDMLSPDTPIPARCRTCHFNTTGTQTVNGNPDIPDKMRNDYRYLRRPCFLGIGGCKEP